MFLLLELNKANLVRLDMNPASRSFNLSPSSGSMYCFSFSESSLNHDNESAKSTRNEMSVDEMLFTSPR